MCVSSVSCLDTVGRCLMKMVGHWSCRLEMDLLLASSIRNAWSSNLFVSMNQIRMGALVDILILLVFINVTAQLLPNLSWSHIP